MSLVVIGIVVFVLLIVLTNTKRWKRLASGAKRAKDELETEVTTPEGEDRRT
jgi:hypothetical protein